MSWWMLLPKGIKEWDGSSWMKCLHVDHDKVACLGYSVQVLYTLADFLGSEIMSRDGIAGCSIWSRFLSWGAIVFYPVDSLASVENNGSTPQILWVLDVKDGQSFLNVTIIGRLTELQWFFQESGRSPSASLSSTTWACIFEGAACFPWGGKSRQIWTERLLASVDKSTKIAFIHLVM